MGRPWHARFAVIEDGRLALDRVAEVRDLGRPRLGELAARLATSLGARLEVRLHAIAEGPGA